MNLKTTAGEPISTSRTQRLDVALGASAMGKPCRQPAMPNGRCRVHGGLSTGPRTPEGLERSRRSNWKHGYYSEEASKCGEKRIGSCRCFGSLSLQRTTFSTSSARCDARCDGFLGDRYLRVP